MPRNKKGKHASERSDHFYNRQADLYKEASKLRALNNEENNLYVITTIFNPKKFASRIHLYKEFEKRILDSGSYLIVIEATFRDNEQEVIEKVSARHYIIHVKAHCEMWLKENLINVAIKKLYQLFPNWKYLAWVDADLAFARPDWKKETIRLLHHHPIIQMFSHIVQLNSHYQPLSGFSLGFMEGWSQDLPFKNKTVSGEDPTKMRYGWGGAPGGAWAANRECIDKIFPIFDVGILGSGDFHLACALMGYVELTFTQGYSAEYRNYLVLWQERVKHLRGKVGYMKGLIIHYWHGRLIDRGYDTRWKILVRHKFNPLTDLITDSVGVYSIHPDKEGLIRDIEDYFTARKEDDK